jgi:hypothetical protein
MLDEDGKLKYPPKVRKIEVEKMKIRQTKETPTPGTVKLRVSFTSGLIILKWILGK